MNATRGLAVRQPGPSASRRQSGPAEILGQATDQLLAFGAAAALCRQQLEGGSWQVEVALARTGHWLRQLGRAPPGWTRPSMPPGHSSARW